MASAERAVRARRRGKGAGLRQVSGRSVCGRYDLWPAPCAANTRARGCLPSTRKRRRLCPAWSACYTAEDIPGEIKVGHHAAGLGHDDPRRQDHPLPRRRHLPCGGGDDQETLEQAKKLVEVDYEPLTRGASALGGLRRPALCAPRRDMRSRQPAVRTATSARGNADRGHPRRPDYVHASYHYETPWTEHAFLEPECAVAYRDEDG